MQRDRPAAGPLAPDAVPIARALRDSVHARAEQFTREHVVERIWARDTSLWRPEPTEVADRLGWLDLDADMAMQTGVLEAFARQVIADGYSTAVVLGMGGSSLAPRVLATAFAGHTRGIDLLVLDSTVPAAVRAIEERAPRGRTLFIVSSKSGTTLETATLLDYFWEREPEGRHFVAITDPGSPLEAHARGRAFRRVFLNRCDIGGRFSALSYVGLVPAALIGVDLARLLGCASDMREACGVAASPLENPGAQLGILIAEAALLGRDALTLRVDEGLGVFGAWLEQLIAESTGKEGRGVLPVCDEPLGTPEVYDDSRFLMVIGESQGARALEALTDHGRLPLASYSPGDTYRLGGEFFRWEFAVAVAGHILGINPFDQPDVEATKRETARLLEGGEATADTRTVEDLLARFEPSGSAARSEPPEYLAIHAYLPRSHANEHRLREVRARLRDRLRIPTMVEYGPSLLHSTGQYHKGGRRRGAFVQLIDGLDRDPLAIPGRDYDFGRLAAAQAEGDAIALGLRGRLVARATLDGLESIAGERR